MTETPQRRALHRSGAAVGVDFYLVAKSARFVAVIIFGTLTAWSDIKARKLAVLFTSIACRGIPAIAAFIRRNTDARIVLEALATVDEDIGPVLFTGDVSAPGRHAVTAVVIGTASLRAVRGELSFYIVATRHGAGKIHHRGAGEAAVIGRISNVRPLAAGVFLYFDDRHAMGVDFSA